MRIAIFDLGTNSVRFDVHQVSEQGTHRLYREKHMVRLGQDVFLTGKLNSEAKARTLHSLEGFKNVADKLRVEKIIAFATSAMREASDSASFIRQIKKRTGLRVKVISGAEEARLIAIGILANERIPRGHFALVDIGGGSTEISACIGRSFAAGQSLQLGCARLQQVFLRRSPPSRASILELRTEIQKVLAKNPTAGFTGRIPCLMGSSGTIRALFKFLGGRESGELLPLSALSRGIQVMERMNRAELSRLPGIDPGRSEFILAGAILLEEIAKALGSEAFTATDFSLRDGILSEEIERFRKIQPRKIMRGGFSLDSLASRAMDLGVTNGQIQKARRLTQGIFRKLRPLHRLEPQWMSILSAAAVLKNSGERIGFAGRAAHSYYIIKHLDQPDLSPLDADLIARLCLHCDHKKLDPIRLGEADRRAFLPLLVMLQMTDSLDHAPKRIQVTRDRVRVSLQGGAKSFAESHRLEKKKKRFERVFDRKLEINSALQN